MTRKPPQFYSLRLAAKLGAIATAILLTGCRPTPQDEVAPVSGTVRLDGKPLEGVKVLFVPLERDDEGHQGPVAYAMTDANGHYSLAHRGGGNGAATGRNQVWLTTRQVEEKKDTDGEVQVVEIAEELIPARYNKATEIVIDVPENGVKNADFDVESDPRH